VPVVVLDAFAALAVLNDEESAERVEAVIASGDALMSWINVGEVYYRSVQQRSRAEAEAALRGLRATVQMELPDAQLVLAAARLKSAHQLSYADAFCVATAQNHGAPLWTGDPEILALGDLVDAVDLRPEAAP
jgi:PIN domain nuclease of toxin-antitoxin system